MVMMAQVQNEVVSLVQQSVHLPHPLHLPLHRRNCQASLNSARVVRHQAHANVVRVLAPVRLYPMIDSVLSEVAGSDSKMTWTYHRDPRGRLSVNYQSGVYEQPPQGSPKMSPRGRRSWGSMQKAWPSEPAETVHVWFEAIYYSSSFSLCEQPLS